MLRWCVISLFHMGIFTFPCPNPLLGYPIYVCKTCLRWQATVFYTLFRGGYNKCCIFRGCRNSTQHAHKASIGQGDGQSVNKGGVSYVHTVSKGKVGDLLLPIYHGLFVEKAFHCLTRSKLIINFHEVFMNQYYKYFNFVGHVSKNY